MGFKCGIVGLPNVGKSTLFNALTSSKNAQAANFPFCTIDPNIGIVDVPDKRLDTLSSLSKSKKKINANITFVDIAGLVKGASKGEGLGNKFLSHIREVDAIVHLVRCFDSEKIQHVNKKIDPLNDLETIKTEILLSDINLLEKKLQKNMKKKMSEKETKLLETVLDKLNKGKSLEEYGDPDSKKILKEANKHKIKVRAYISCVLGCPYEGKVSFKKTSDLASFLIDEGCYEVSLGDTVGYGTPNETKYLINDFKCAAPVPA